MLATTINILFLNAVFKIKISSYILKIIIIFAVFIKPQLVYIYVNKYEVLKLTLSPSVYNMVFIFEKVNK